MITPSFSLTSTERVLPRLALDFTTGLLDSRVTVARVTSASNPATYVNSSGLLAYATNDQPRFDYNATTLVCKGLLIEESRANLLTFSSNFGNANWLNGATLVSSTEIAPDGSASAYTVNDTSVASALVIQRQAAQTVTANAPYSTSVFIKKTTGAITNYPGIAVALTGVATRVGYAILDTTTGNAVVPASGTVNLQSASVEDFGTYWRLKLSFQDNASNTLCRVVLYPAMSSDGTTVSNAATGPATFWGAQLEAGAFATSYIPTTTTSLTRNADVVSMTGANFSSWYNVGAGSWYIQTNARNAATILTAGTFSLAATATALKKYANSYASDQSATSLVLGQGTVAKVSYYKQTLLPAELAALTN